METSLKKKLKVALILDEGEIASWISHFISRVNESPYLELSFLLYTSSENIEKSKKDSWLYRLYCKIEEHRWESFDEEYLVGDIAGVPSQTINSNCLISPTSDLYSEMSEQQLDVILNLTLHSMGDSFSQLTKAGVWAFHYSGEETKNSTNPLGFWEVYDDVITMESLLFAIVPNQNELVKIEHAKYATSDQSSAHVNRSKSYRTSISMLSRSLQRLYTLGTENFLVRHTQETDAECLSSTDFRSTKPSNMKMSYFFMRKFLRSLKMRLIHKFFSEQWSMRYQLGNGFSKTFGNFKKLTPSQGGLWADPFITHHDGIYYLFFEDAIYDKENADISVMTIDEKGNVGEPQPCLIKPYHLSYPFVFFWEGEHYMIPETKSNNAIEIYKAKQFPDQWVFHSNLMEDVQAVDTTLLFHNDKWWLFTSLKSEKWVSINNELSIFYADSPLSTDWTPHAMNPVVSDVKRARPAGRIFEEDGKIIRPSQDSSVRYGYGLRLNEILTLTEDYYEEREIDFIEPTWEFKLRGTHTLAHEKNLTVIDVLEWRSKFR